MDEEKKVLKIYVKKEEIKKIMFHLKIEEEGKPDDYLELNQIGLRQFLYFAESNYKLEVVNE